MPADQENREQLAQEVAKLRKMLTEKEQTIQKLSGWLQNLHQDVKTIYHSIVWQIGEIIVKFFLKLLRRPFDTTVTKHIDKICQDFVIWRANYQTAKSYKISEICPAWHDTQEYTQWLARYETADVPVAMDVGQKCPTVSLLLVIHNTDGPIGVERAVESVWVQMYPAWELCVVYQNVLPLFLQKYVNFDNRIKFVNFSQNGSQAMLLNAALQIATGDFIVLLGAHDQLSKHALYKIGETVTIHPQVDLIYTDEDKLAANGQRYDPYFKPDWNLDLFYSHNYLGHLVAYRRNLVQQLGGFELNSPGSEEYDLSLRFIEQIPANHIYHVPQVLYHQHEHCVAESTLCQALQAHFQRLQQVVEILETLPRHTRVRYPLPTPPLVSLIMPTRDQPELLRVAVNSLLKKTDYKPLELIIVDNGSISPVTLAYFQEIQQDQRVKIIHWDAPFNYSQLNNFGVKHATGEIIGLINNDVEVINADWLQEMVSQALRPNIGAVGAKLYYPDNTLQHAGLILGIGSIAKYVLKHLARENCGYRWKPFLVQNYSAVTGACLVMRRQLFVEIGGLNEKHLKVAFNDIDLCLRLRERGYRIVWTPYAELYHHESASRGHGDNTLRKFLRLRQEIRYMQSRWGHILSRDPYYNPNLTLEYEDFSLAYPIIFS